jgi:hypothetical protein
MGGRRILMIIELQYQMLQCTHDLLVQGQGQHLLPACQQILPLALALADRDHTPEDSH